MISSISRFARHHWSLIIEHCSHLHHTAFGAVLVLIMVGLILVAPLLQSSPLCTDDGALHIYRTVALDRAIHDGLLYPRWFPDLAFGYGFPFFNYREPLGYYVVEGLHLIGLNIPLALNLILAGSVILGGLAMAWWVSDLFDRRAGCVAGIVYMAAPYSLIGAMERANLPEVIALALLPLILWAFRRLSVRGGRRYFAAAVLSYAALLLTHNISSLIFTPMLLLYCVFHIPSTASDHPQHTTLNALFAMILALAATSFFWLPALTEGNAAQLYLTHSAYGNDYHNNFLSLAEIFSGPGTSDPALLNPPLRMILGWPQIALALLGLLAWRKTPSREQRAHIVAAAIMLVGCLVMALPLSLPIWDHLPLIRFVQFPWRFIGRAILPAALLAGAAISRQWSVFSIQPSALSAQRIAGSRFGLIIRHSSLVILSIIILLFTAPLLYPRSCAAKPDLNMTDVFAYEHTTGQIGIDPLGAYLPVTVKVHPTGSPLEQQYASGQALQRFDRSTLPAQARLIAESYQPNQAEIDLESPIGFRATYLTFDFPGWQVSIDRQAAPIIPSDSTGLITFDLPAGQHHISIVFGSTPIRSIADIASIAGLLVFVVSLLRIRQAIHHEDTRTQRKEPGPWVWLLLVPITFVLIKLLLVDAQLTPLRMTQLQNDHVSGLDHPLQIDFGDRLRLLGYTLSASTAPSGESVRVDLYWRALTPLDTEYQTTLGLVDANGEVQSPKTLNRPRDYQDYPPTTQWLPGSYTVDSFELPILPGTAPGSYSIFVEVFQRSNSSILLAAQAAAPHPSSRPAAAIIGSIEVTRAVHTFSPAQLSIYNSQQSQALAPDLQLLGFNLDYTERAPGDSILLTLFWQATQKPTEDRTLKIELIDQYAQTMTSRDFPIGGRYRTSNWANGEQVVDLDRVRVPVNTPGGVYRWRGSIGSTTIDLGQLNVAAPDRSFEVPPLQNRIDQTLGRQVTLLGYERPMNDSRQLSVVVYWRAEAEMDKSYKVFVQLLDANGQPRVQVDAVPVNWTRPTTGWLPGEVVKDVYALTLPADLPKGPYRLVAGLYGEDDLMRLRLANGSDHIELTTIDIGP